MGLMKNSSYSIDRSLSELITQNLQQFEPVALTLEGRKHAAVAFTLVDCAQPAGIGEIAFNQDEIDQAGFILTIRASKLSNLVTLLS